MNIGKEKVMVAALFMGLVFCVPMISPAESICTAPVQTAEGPVLGVDHAKHAACAWKGIPFAAPPIDELRWRAPQPAASRDHTFEAYAYGPSCMQKESFTSGGKSDSYSEDCLYLNIWRPKKSGTFPVMYWIYGGGFTQGGADYEMYEGARLAADRDVVVVTVNYRLGVLGFLAMSELDEDPEGSGNYGLLDQVKGLEWVRDNIAGFGGDPNNVTIFGHSAGGASVCTLVGCPLAKGLFHKAIIQSGACDLTRTLEKGYKAGASLAEAVGCAGDNILECMRQVPADTYLETRGEGFSAAPHVGGKALPISPVEAIRTNNYNKVPVMVGATRDELKMALVFMGAGILPRSTAIKLMRKTIGDRTDEIVPMYPRSEYKCGLGLLNGVFADGFGSRAFQAAEELSARTPVYMYRFDWDEQANGRALGAFHGLELGLVFGTIDNFTLKRSMLAAAFSKRAIKRGTPLSEQMMSYWTNFAKTGDPNGPGLPEWPTYNTTSRERIHFDSTISVAPIAGKDLERYQYFSSLTLEDLRFSE